MNKKFTITEKSRKLRGQIVKKSKLLHDLVSERRKHTQNDKSLDQIHHEKRIWNAHATLAMKNSKLTLSQVTDVIEGGHSQLAPNEILAVKNAYEAYSLLYFPHFVNRVGLDPYNIHHIQDIHRAFMAGLSKQTGPADVSAEKLQNILGNLIKWVQDSKEGLLIKACVFHYNFIMISPFNEGNEYIARLWQMLLVQQNKGDWVYTRVPAMKVLLTRRQEYYNILAIADKAAGCTMFIEFMLQTILDAMTEYEEDASQV